MIRRRRMGPAGSDANRAAGLAVREPKATGNPTKSDAPLRRSLGAVGRGAYRLHQLNEEDLARAAELERTYASLDLGLVDASVIVSCEQLGETKVATLDRRDFSIVKPRHCDALTLLPE